MPTDRRAKGPGHQWPRIVGRCALGGFLIFAGISHLAAREQFLAQVPPFFPVRDAIVVVSGFVEMAMGAWLVSGWRRHLAGWVAAAFFIAVFPGNISQFITGASAFGLDTDLKRGLRLLFQPVLVLWALWASGAWAAWRWTR